MPTLQDYRALAPFSLDELVNAANSVLRERPRLHVSKRTVRYYIQVGVVPPPQGSPKFARYGMAHLTRLVGARCLLDQGQTLQSAPRELDRLEASGDVEFARAVQMLADEMREEPSLYAASVAPSAPALVREAHAPRLDRGMHRTPIDHVRRIPLTQNATLEVRGEDLQRVLEEAAQALQILVKGPDPT